MDGRTWAEEVGGWDEKSSYNSRRDDGAGAELSWAEQFQLCFGRERRDENFSEAIQET